MDYSQVLPNLFVGSHPRTPADIDELQRETGVTAVLNLQTSEDMEFLRIPWAQLEKYYAKCGVEVKRVPVRDFDPIDLQAKLLDCVLTLLGLLRGGHNVYLHCTAGTGRSPTMAIAYLNWCHGWSLSQAEQHVRERRPCSPNLEAIRLADHP